MIKVINHKSLFLLYSFLLNQLGLLSKGDTKDTHHLKRKTYEHFKKYRKKHKEIIKDLRNYGYYAHILYMFALSDFPNPKEKKVGLDPDYQTDFEKGRKILPALIDFYEKTDFEEYYRSCMPFLKAEREFVQSMLKIWNIENILNEAWEYEDKRPYYVIPMPLARWHGGKAWSINGKEYCKFGAPYCLKSLSHPLTHELSHPRARDVMSGFKDEIAALKDLEDRYNIKQYWRTFLEEHLVRAVMFCSIDPLFDNQLLPNIDKVIETHKKKHNMVYMREFYEEVKYCKDNNIPLKKGFPRILKRLK